MSQSTFRKIWRAPLILAALIVFGLLAALLGTGVWHLLSWAALSVPFGVLVFGSKNPTKSDP